MRLIICNSKSWFKISSSLRENFDIIEINHPDDLTLRKLKDLNPGGIFFIHWNWVVEKSIYEAFQCIVFHTSPLPYGRGGSPIQNLILGGFKYAPVCAVQMVNQLDSGPVFLRHEISLVGSLKQIFTRISDAINKMIESICKKNILPQAQIGEPYVFKRRKIEDNRIPIGLTLSEFYDRVRMLDANDYPHAFITYGSLKIEFSRAILSENRLTVMCEIKCED